MLSGVLYRTLDTSPCSFTKTWLAIVIQYSTNAIVMLTFCSGTLSGIESWLVDCLFNLSTQKGQCVPTAGERELEQVFDSATDLTH